MTITIGYTLDARCMLDEADGGSPEHGFAIDNPLLDPVEHAREMLRVTPARAGDPPSRPTSIEIVAVWFANRGSEPPL